MLQIGTVVHKGLLLQRAQFNSLRLPSCLSSLLEFCLHNQPLKWLWGHWKPKELRWDVHIPTASPLLSRRAWILPRLVATSLIMSSSVDFCSRQYLPCPPIRWLMLKGAKQIKQRSGLLKRKCSGRHWKWFLSLPLLNLLYRSSTIPVLLKSWAKPVIFCGHSLIAIKPFVHKNSLINNKNVQASVIIKTPYS